MTSIKSEIPAEVSKDGQKTPLDGAKHEDKKTDAPKVEDKNIVEVKPAEKKPEVAKPEDKKVEVPKVEVKKPEEPKPAEKKVDVPPKIEEKKVDVPKVDVPKVEEKKTQDTKPVEKKPDAPKPEEKKVEPTKPADIPKTLPSKPAETQKIEPPKPVEVPKVQPPKPVAFPDIQRNQLIGQTAQIQFQADPQRIQELPDIRIRQTNRGKSVKQKPAWNDRFYVEDVVNFTPAHPYFKKYFDKPPKRTPYNRFREMDFEKFGFSRVPKNHLYQGNNSSHVRSSSQDNYIVNDQHSNTIQKTSPGRILKGTQDSKMSPSKQQVMSGLSNQYGQYSQSSLTGGAKVAPQQRPVGVQK